MKIKHVLWLVVASLFVGLIGLTSVEPTAAQEQGTQNLLVNPGFEEGHYSQDGIAEITVPNGWRMHWLDGVPFPGSDNNAARPETVVWYIQDAPLSERAVFFRDGSYALKVFKGGLPMYAALSQDVQNLEVGRRYRLVAPVYVDIVERWDGTQKVYASDPDAGMVRLGAGPVGAPWLDMAAISYSGTWTAASVSPFYGAYPVFVYDFTATQANMTVYVEFGSRNSYANNGFFVDTLGLYTLDEVDTSVGSNPAPSNPPVSSGPPATPFPTPTPRADGAIVHVVQAGDTLWSISARYASALGLSAEEALPVIRELNNNPTFINVGQELLILVPDGSAPAVEAVAEETQESTPAAEEATPEPTAEPAQPKESAVETPEAQPELIAEVVESNAICVSAFDDANGDGVPDSNEGLLADAVFTISRASGTVATYVSDGINEPYCFRELEAGTYQINFSQPESYQLTTAGDWAIAVAGSAEIPVQFGAQYGPELVAEQQPAAAVEEVASDATTVAEEASGGLSSNIGTIILVIVVVLIVLAGVGVMLLRRS